MVMLGSPERIKQHRATPGGQDETVAVRPACGGGVIFAHVGEQHGGDVGGAHRQTRMTRFRLFHRIHGERANGIRHFVMGDFIVVGRHQRFTLRAELAGSCAIAAPSGAGPRGAKAWLGQSGNRRKACITASSMFFLMSRFNVLGRENDFAATFALLSRRVASILARIT
jgi:hypothetical protein